MQCYDMFFASTSRIWNVIMCRMLHLNRAYTSVFTHFVATVKNNLLTSPCRLRVNPEMIHRSEISTNCSVYWTQQGASSSYKLTKLTAPTRTHRRHLEVRGTAASYTTLEQRYILQFVHLAVCFCAFLSFLRMCPVRSYRDISLWFAVWYSHYINTQSFHRSKEQWSCKYQLSPPHRKLTFVSLEQNSEKKNTAAALIWGKTATKWFSKALKWNLKRCSIWMQFI